MTKGRPKGTRAAFVKAAAPGIAPVTDCTPGTKYIYPGQGVVTCSKKMTILVNRENHEVFVFTTDENSATFQVPVNRVAKRSIRALLSREQMADVCKAMKDPGLIGKIPNGPTRKAIEALTRAVNSTDPMDLVQAVRFAYRSRQTEADSYKDLGNRALHFLVDEYRVVMNTDVAVAQVALFPHIDGQRRTVAPTTEKKAKPMPAAA